MSDHIQQPDGAQAIVALLDALETCHICKGVLSLDDGSPTHCENCSWDCDEHDEPECVPLYVLHRNARQAIADLQHQLAAIKAELARALEGLKILRAYFDNAADFRDMAPTLDAQLTDPDNNTPMVVFLDAILSTPGAEAAMKWLEGEKAKAISQRLPPKPTGYGCAETARAPGMCAKCAQPIYVGDEISRDDSGPVPVAFHIRCDTRCYACGKDREAPNA